MVRNLAPRVLGLATGKVSVVRSDGKQAGLSAAVTGHGSSALGDPPAKHAGRHPQHRSGGSCRSRDGRAQP
ncbi:MAG: hypothetical protein QOC77_3002 [Thermoleophilaceae bacterium]|nr:hypothetical protein [Thermoleophilaceae bacterium]